MKGETVVVIIDDRDGRGFAATTRALIAHARQQDRAIGHMHLTSTTDLIRQRINTSDIPDQDTLARIWADISRMDDDLPNHVPNPLMACTRWNGPLQH